jgi:hypothetical protein
MTRTINYSLFRTGDLISFSRNLLLLFHVEAMNDGVLKNLVQKMANTYELFENGRQLDRKNPHTKELKQDDSVRSKALNGLKYYIKSFVYSEIDAEAKAAETLVRCIKKYGWNAADLRYTQKTHAITMILQEFSDKYQSEMDLLGTASRMSYLQRAEDAFEQTLNKQIQAGAEMPPTATSYRLPLITSLRNVIRMVDIEAETLEDEALAKLSLSIDALILDTMSPLKSRKTRRENKKRLQGAKVADKPENS